MKEMIRQPLRAVRYLPDRLLHSYRQRRLLESLHTRRVSSVLFVCHGNINRSAYAAAAFARLIGADGATMHVRSAGFIGGDRPASELAQVVAARRRLDLSGHRSRLLDVGELRGTDLIVVMNRAQRTEICRLAGRTEEDVVLLGDLDPAPIARRTVQDPYGYSEQVFEQVFDRIDRCVGVLAERLRERNGAST